MGALPGPREYMAFDAGQLAGAAEISFFQRLIDAGQLDTLGVRYTRRAEELLKEGLIYA